MSNDDLSIGEDEVLSDSDEDADDTDMEDFTEEDLSLDDDDDL